jgi:hypothetical protein
MVTRETRMNADVIKLKRIRNKRVTVDVKPEIDKIRERIKQDTGVVMTYVQTFDFLIDFYMKHANEPRTQWRPLK